MMPPVVTALCSYVPPVVKLDEQVSAMEPTTTRPLTGWDAWMALWRTECTPFGPTAMPRIGPRDRSLLAPIAHTTDLSGLAAYVTRAICAARPRAAAPVDVVIFCHSSVDEHISTTTAGRLANVVGAPRSPCFSFSISQQGSTAPFTALRLAQDLFFAERDLRTILIAAAEKWVAPFSRHTGTGPLQGDAAAALLLERFGASTRGLRLIDAQTHPCPTPSGDAPHRHAHPDPRLLQTMLQLIATLLAKHAIAPCDVIAVGQCHTHALSAALQQELGIASLAGMHMHDANLGVADSIEQLTSMAQTHTFPSQHTLLLWNIASCGYVGCALLDAHSAPLVARSPWRELLMVDTTIGIPCVAYHLPEHVDSVRHWARRTGQPAAVVAKLEQAGVRNFHVARGQSAFSLAIQAVDSLLRNAPITRESIDCLVYTHTLQGSITPPPVSLPRQLCEHFCLVGVPSFSFAQQHCASSLGALRIIRAMFIAHPALHRILLVGADVMPMETERAMGASGLLGDGAFAALVERHACTNRLVALATHASGRGWRGMLGQVEASFLAQYQLVARKLIAQVAQDAHIALTELDRILPPHLNQPAWRRLVQSMGLPPERLFAHNFSRIAHVTVSDPFINLADCGPIAQGAPLVLYAQGVGGFSAAALLIH